MASGWQKDQVARAAASLLRHGRIVVRNRDRGEAFSYEGSLRIQPVRDSEIGIGGTANGARYFDIYDASWEVVS